MYTARKTVRKIMTISSDLKPYCECARFAFRRLLGKFLSVILPQNVIFLYSQDKIVFGAYFDKTLVIYAKQIFFAVFKNTRRNNVEKYLETCDMKSQNYPLTFKITTFVKLYANRRMNYPGSLTHYTPQ